MVRYFKTTNVKEAYKSLKIFGFDIKCDDFGNLECNIESACESCMTPPAGINIPPAIMGEPTFIPSEFYFAIIMKDGSNPVITNTPELTELSEVEYPSEAPNFA